MVPVMPPPPRAVVACWPPVAALVELEVGVVLVDEHPARKKVPAASAATMTPARLRADVVGFLMMILRTCGSWNVDG
jgi:hypothetical protein